MSDAAHECRRCGVIFSYRSQLTRHEQRKVACDAAPFKCWCGRTYVHKSGLSRHQVTCGVTPPPHASQSATHVATTGDVNTMVNGDVVNTTVNIMIGWPPSWPRLEETPEPFDPENMKINPSTIMRELGGLGSATPEEADMVEIVMRILEDVHDRPELRNIYPNPSRCDQTLTFAVDPDRWDVAPRSETQKKLIERILETIRRVFKRIPPPERVCRAATPAFIAHLQNLKERVLSGAGAPARPAARICESTPRTHFFEEEETQPDIAHSKLCSLADDLEGDMEVKAAKVLRAFDLYMRDRGPMNHTAFEAHGTAWVWDVAREGKQSAARWLQRDPGEVARACALSAIRALKFAVGAVPVNEESAPLRAIADALAGTDVTPLGVAVASGEAGTVIFARRSARAVQFYLGDSGAGRAGPCPSDCACSRGAARAILEQSGA